jgi:hypothetical protein
MKLAPQPRCARSHPTWPRTPPAPHAPGLNKQAIIERVARAGMRPRFPSATPKGYVELASACWAADPAARPSFKAIILQLHAMLDESMAAAAGADAAAPLLLPPSGAATPAAGAATPIAGGSPARAPQA